MTQPNQQQINLAAALKSSTSVRCQSEGCGSMLFEPVMIIRKISRFVTGSSQDDFLPMQVFVCKYCGELNEDMLPPALVELLEQDAQNNI